MPVGEICNRVVVITRREDTILAAAKLMRQHHVGDVVVVDESGSVRIPVGIVTDRDLVIDIMATELDQKVMTVGDIMIEDLVSVKESLGVRGHPVHAGESRAAAAGSGRTRCVGGHSHAGRPAPVALGGIGRYRPIDYITAAKGKRGPPLTVRFRQGGSFSCLASSSAAGKRPLLIPIRHPVLRGKKRRRRNRSCP